MIDKLNVILNIDNLQAKCDSPPPVMQDLCLQVKDGVQNLKSFNIGACHLTKQNTTLNS